MDLAKELQQYPTETTEQYLTRLRSFRYDIERAIDKAELERVKLCKSFLPRDVREKIEDFVADSYSESWDGDCSCGDIDTDLLSDEELLGELQDMTGEEDELYQEGLGYQAEHEMLSQRSVGEHGSTSPSTNSDTNDNCKLSIVKP
jgi:hypothetical protein